MPYPTQDITISSSGDVANELAEVEAVERLKYIGQAIPYAASITPDPGSGEIVVVGTLTGAITIANPPSTYRIVGRKLTFRWTQDGSGGRVITWGSDFLAGAAAATTASKDFCQTFVWDGTKWSAMAAAFLLN